MSDAETEIPYWLDLSSSTVSFMKRAALLIAVGAIILSYLGRRYGWLDYKPGGAAFDVNIRPIFTSVFIVALLLALRWQIVGGILAGFAGAALIAFAANQLVPLHAAIVVAMLAIPAVVWVVVDLNQLSARRTLVGVGLTVAIAGAGFVVGQLAYDYLWGPTHPDSEVAQLEASPLEWVWAGAVAQNEAEVRAHPATDFESSRLALSTSPDFANPRWVEPRDESGRVIGFDLDQLEPDTKYFYAIEVDGELDLVRSGELTTFPTGPASFEIAVGSCARVGSNGRVFDTIRELDPLLYLIAGDLHYGDNGRNDLVRYQEVMDLTLSRPAQSALYRSTPVAYMWDDHDYGGNDSDGSSPSREAAMSAYREYVPSYDLANDQSAIYQAYSIGRVRFIMTDARSARNLDNDDNTDAPSMLGSEQKAWLKEELIEANETHELLVWLNPVPWVAEASDGADNWAGYAVERAELANFIADNDIDNLMMVSGDAHMVAIDDGTNTDYSTAQEGGFPLLHAAALDRPGGIKGGPYSEGAIDDAGQFATIGIDDDGSEINVTLRGMNWKGEIIVEHQFSTG